MDPVAPTIVQTWHTPPRGRGRRRVSGAPATRMRHIRLTEVEDRALEVHALSRGQTVTECIRQALAQHLAEPVRPVEAPTTDTETIARLRQIGGLLKMHLVAKSPVGGVALRTVLADLSAEIARMRRSHVD